MNVSYNTTSNKAMNTIDHTFADATTDGKGKNYPIQMYGGSASNSPNQPAYGLGTPSPPMTAVPSRPVSNNSNIMASSSLTMPQYPSQLSQSQHQQSDQAMQAQHARQHRQAESSTLSQQQLRLQRQQQQQQGQLQQQHQAQLQQLQQHQQLQQNPYQSHQQQHDMRQIAGQQNAKQYEKHQQQQQRASAQQVFDFHDPSLTGNHYQDHSRTMPNRQSINSPSSGQVSHDHMRQSANTYTNDETSVQDPQLRHLHHLQSQQQQQQQHQQQNPQNQHQQHPQQHRQFGHHSHQIQLEQPNRDLSDGVVHDPRLQGSLNHDQRGLQAMSEASFPPSHMQTQAQLNQMSPGLTDGVHLQHSQQVTSSKMGDQTITIITKMVAATDEDGSKKKRGRPKKLILDPATNQYIDSSHQNFKKLNKLLKQSTDITVKQANSPMENGIKLASLNDQEMKQLLESKDRRGRPRKFPVEQTGITIKGVRMSGTMKVKKKAPAVSLDPSGKVEKKKRGRPKRDATAAVKIV